LSSIRWLSVRPGFDTLPWSHSTDAGRIETKDAVVLLAMTKLSELLSEVQIVRCALMGVIQFESENLELWQSQQ